MLSARTDVAVAARAIDAATKAPMNFLTRMNRSRRIVVSLSVGRARESASAADARILAVRPSTISKSAIAGRGTRFARTLGSTIRQRRETLGLTQQEVGEPLSKSFISLVENGQVSPSLASLVLISARLEVPAWKLLRVVSHQMTKESRRAPHEGDALEGS